MSCVVGDANRLQGVEVTNKHHRHRLTINNHNNEGLRHPVRNQAVVTADRRTNLLHRDKLPLLHRLFSHHMHLKEEV